MNRACVTLKIIPIFLWIFLKETLIKSHKHVVKEVQPVNNGKNYQMQ